MFKLRETWHDVFPATKLYQLDVKVNLIDPAWPIQAQPHQSNIHVNPNFLKKVILVDFVYTIVWILIYHYLGKLLILLSASVSMYKVIIMQISYKLDS